MLLLDKMEQHVPAEHKVDFLEGVLGDVLNCETVLLIFRLVVGDEGGDDIDAHIVNAGKIDFLHPVEVAAGRVQH